MNSMLRVLVVSSDRSLLRQAAFLLNEFGYQPVCQTSVAAAAWARNAGSCDFLIVDDDLLAGDYEQLRYARRRRDLDHLHIYLLSGDIDNLDVEHALECGVDDFLKKPLSSGEVLARLRAGARYCEFQRRSCRQQWHDPLTGLASQKSLLEHTRKALADRGRSGSVSLAVVDLDMFDDIRAALGRDIANDVLCAVVQVIKDSCAAGQVAARLQNGQFAILLADHSSEKASKWAEQLRHAIAELELAQLEPLSHVTASIGLATGDNRVTAEELYSRAQSALSDAHCCGRDCLASYGEFDEQRDAWQQLLQSGNPFQLTTARDVMTPFSLMLHPEDSVGSALSVHQQTRLEWLPVADDGGGWAGIVDAGSLGERSQVGDQGAPLRDFLCGDVAQIPDTANFSALMDCFGRQEEPVVVVTRGGQPQGFISREQFLALVRPISADMFVSSSESLEGTDSLVVPDVVCL